MSQASWVSLEMYGLTAGFAVYGGRLFPAIIGDEKSLATAKGAIESLEFRQTSDGSYVAGWANLPTAESWQEAFPAASFASLAELAAKAALTPDAKEKMISSGLVAADSWPESKSDNVTPAEESKDEVPKNNSDPEWSWLNLEAYGLEVVVRVDGEESLIRIEGPNAAKHLIKDDLVASGAVINAMKAEEVSIVLPKEQGAFNIDELRKRLPLAKVDKIASSLIPVKRDSDPEREVLSLSNNINRTAFLQTVSAKVREGTKAFSHEELAQIGADSMGVSPMLMRNEFGITARALQEQLESSLTEIFTKKSVTQETADDMIELGHSLDKMMPRESASTGSSKSLQQFSTPLSISAAVQSIIGLEGGHKVWEPTAGNASLVSMVESKNVAGLEIDSERVKNLHAKGYRGIEQGDAIHDSVGERKFPRVIMNPPFGAFPDGKGGRVYESDLSAVTGGPSAFIRTTSQDKYIALRHLQRLQKDGVAALILGADHPMKYKAGEYSDDTKNFLQFLGDTHNILDVHYIEGKLYGTHGAEWPLLVVITGDKRDELGNYTPPDTLPTISDLKGLKLYAQKQKELVLAYEAERGEGPGSTRSGKGRGEGAKEQEQTEEQEAVAVAGSDQGSTTTAPNEAQATDEELGHESPEGVGDLITSEGDSDDTRQRHALDTEEKEVPYVPRSKMLCLGKRVPANLAAPIENALNRVENTSGDIDVYVANEIGWSLNELKEALAAEQVDAIALALHQAKQGKGFILGDNTGIGKGRVVAALAVWGIRNGYKPIFCTSKSDLFGDIMRDFDHIGEAGLIKPFVLNNLAKDIVSSQTGEVIVKRTPRKVVNKAIKESTIPEEYNMVFMTFSQINRSLETCRKAQWLIKVSEGGVLLADEVHNASGPDSNTGYNLRDAIRGAKFTLGSSATYAKRPDNLGLYEFTSMFEGSDPQSVIESVAIGGPEYQEVLSTMLAESGQLIVRAHESPPPPRAVVVNPAYSEGYDSLEFSDRLARVLDAMTVVAESTEIIVNRENEGIREAIASLPNEQKAGLSHWKSQSVNFGSQMHNIVRVANYAAKADSVVEEVMAAVQEGRRPLIAVEGTMESFLRVAFQDALQKREEARQAEAERLGVEISEVPVDTTPIATDLTYRDTIKSYLDKMVIIKRTDRYGNESNEQIVEIDQYLEAYKTAKKEVHEGGLVENLISKDLESEIISAEQASILRVYFKVLELVDALPASLPASPIDYVRGKLENIGIRTGELTGRSLGLNYNTNSGVPEFKIRDEADKNRIQEAHRFNNEDLQALVFNSAAAEGVSLHAHKDFKNNEDRRTIFWQVPGDVNTYTQMGGRTHRSGAREGASPDYRVLCLDTPVEDRQMANLERKEGSLKANIKADRETGFAMRSEPMMNRVGDLVTWEVMNNHPLRDSICHRLSINLEHEFEKFSVSGITDKTGSETGLFSKVTGRLCRMVLAESRPLLELMEEAFRERIEYLDRIGNNPLKTQVHDLRATLISKREIFPCSGPSAFESAVIAQQVAYTDYIEPIKLEDIEKQLNKATEILHNRELGKYPMHDFWGQIEAYFENTLEADLENSAFTFYSNLPGKSADKLEQARNIIRAQPEKLPEKAADRLSALVMKEDLMRKLKDRLGVGVEFKDVQVGKILLDCDVEKSNLVLTQILPPHVESNPAMPGNWRLRLESPDAEVGKFNLSLNQLMYLLREYPTIRASTEPLEHSELEQRFHSGREAQALRKERWVIMGNLPKGYSMTATNDNLASGKPGVFTTEDGRKLRGIIMPKNFDTFDLKRLMESRFTISNFDAVCAYIEKKKSESHHPVFMTEAAKQMDIWAKKEKKEFHPGRGVVILRDSDTHEWKMRISAMKKNNAEYLTDGTLLNMLNGDFASVSGVSKTMEAPFTPDKMEDIVKHLLLKHSQVFHGDGSDANWYRDYMRERGERLISQQAEREAVEAAEALACRSDDVAVSIHKIDNVSSLEHQMQFP